MHGGIVLTQLCNCTQSTSEYVRQACHCDFAAALAFDCTSEAAIGRACSAALVCNDVAIVVFDRLVDELATQLRAGHLRRERMLAVIAEVGASLKISPSLQARIVGTVEPPSGSAV